jgi:hypothetical protein
MLWAKKGLIYAQDGTRDWAKHSVLQPTPLVRPDGRIRLYAGFRDAAGVGRVGYVDVAADDPSRVLGVSERPVLDIGAPGAFDDNGVVPTAIVRHEDKVYLYYAGYQLGTRVRFLAFGGRAVSTDGGETFVRHGTVPVMDRTDEELCFRVAHTVRVEGDVWRVWYGGGSEWISGTNKTLPVYDIRYMESTDGVTFPSRGRACLPTAGGDEYRIGRPFVIRHDDLYRMFYCAGSQRRGYRLGYAESADGLRWDRKDDELRGLDVSASGWDSQMVAFPSVVTCGARTYLFYNGNNYGESGVGYAELVGW